MTTNNTTIDSLNLLDNPREVGGQLLGNDGQGNELWMFGSRVANRQMVDLDGEGSTALWSGDVQGWGYTESEDILE